MGMMQSYMCVCMMQSSKRHHEAMHGYTYAHIKMHKYRGYSHINTHTYWYSHINMNGYMCSHINMHGYKYVYIYMYRFTYVHTHMHETCALNDANHLPAPATHIATDCNRLQHTGGYNPQHPATPCNTLQHTPQHTPQHPATHCNTLMQDLRSE